MYCGGTDIGAVVADIGSSVTRIGFAGEDSPRAYFPTVKVIEIFISKRLDLESGNDRK